MEDEIKYSILRELKEWNEKLNKSPGRRDIPSKLNRNCCKYFGSLNKAKETRDIKFNIKKGTLMILSIMLVG